MPIYLPEDTFKQLQHPEMVTISHFLMFMGPKHLNDIIHHSLNLNTLPFYASVQHVNNVDLMVECQECGMWRLLHLTYKLKQEQRIQLQRIVEDHIYTCGSKLS